MTETLNLIFPLVLLGATSAIILARAAVKVLRQTAQNRTHG